MLLRALGEMSQQDCPRTVDALIDQVTSSQARSVVLVDYSFGDPTASAVAEAIGRLRCQHVGMPMCALYSGLLVVALLSEPATPRRSVLS